MYKDDFFAIKIGAVNSITMGDDEYEYVSYKSPKTIVAETTYHFFRGGLYGAAFGLVGTI